MIEVEKKWVLGIESTANVFGVGLCTINGENIIDFKSEYKPKNGGILPRAAAEHHAKNASTVLEKALKKVKVSDIVAIAFSMGPGLGPSLRIGATIARALASYLEIPLYPVHHGVGHIEIGKHLTNAKDPLVVVVSGGHTMITALEEHHYRIYGETLDITIGNLFDMFMREAGYTSPAGHILEELAQRTNKFKELPYTVKGPDLSFSGLLTAVKRRLKKGAELDVLCNSLQETAFSMLVEATERILVHTEEESLLLVGGVANNMRLREMLSIVAREHKTKCYKIEKWNSDNAAQIAYVGSLRYTYDDPISLKKSFVRPSWRLNEVKIPWEN